MILAVALWLLLLIMPAVSALSLAGPRLGTITFQPGASFTNHYTIFGTDQPVIVTVDTGGIFPGITVGEVVDNQFDLIIDFTQEVAPLPGSYTFALTVVENTSFQEGISSQVAVSKTFEVVVHSFEKDLYASLSVPNLNEGSKATIQLVVQSVGYPDIEETYGQVTISNFSGQEVGSVETAHRPLPGLESLSFSLPYDTSNFPTGNYAAKAVVWYDGKFKAANTTFLIGSMDLILDNYTAEFYPGFNDFTVLVTNNWGNSLRNVYVRLFVNGQQLVHTPSITLEPWQQGKLEAILDLELPPGEYPALLKLYFEGESKEIPLAITVLPIVQQPQEIEKKFPPGGAAGLVFLLSAAVAIALLVIFYAWRRQVRKKDKENW